MTSIAPKTLRNPHSTGGCGYRCECGYGHGHGHMDMYTRHGYGLVCGCGWRCGHGHWHMCVAVLCGFTYSPAARTVSSIAARGHHAGRGQSGARGPALAREGASPRGWPGRSTHFDLHVHDYEPGLRREHVLLLLVVHLQATSFVGSTPTRATERTESAQRSHCQCGWKRQGSDALDDRSSLAPLTLFEK